MNKVKEILEFHQKYAKEEETICLRTTLNGDWFTVDAVIWNGKEHLFVDGNFYHNCDGEGMGLTFEDAVNDFHKKTFRPVPERTLY